MRLVLVLLFCIFAALPIAAQISEGDTGNCVLIGGGTNLFESDTAGPSFPNFVVLDADSPDSATPVEYTWIEPLDPGQSRIFTIDIDSTGIDIRVVSEGASLSPTILLCLFDNPGIEGSTLISPTDTVELDAGTNLLEVLLPTIDVPEFNVVINFPEPPEPIDPNVCVPVQRSSVSKRNALFSTANQ
mmetsp:Transcript_9036/g.10030  ORF Transcript_9036/g.10030 Transcript_9036/m.10030 type:complete len:187 (-) Transcript_9036:51-611(-)